MARWHIFKAAKTDPKNLAELYIPTGRLITKNRLAKSAKRKKTPYFKKTNHKTRPKDAPTPTKSTAKKPVSITKAWSPEDIAKKPIKTSPSIERVPQNTALQLSTEDKQLGKVSIPANLLVNNFDQLDQKIIADLPSESLREALGEAEVSIPISDLSVSEKWVQDNLDRLPKDAKISVSLWELLRRLSEEDFSRIGISSVPKNNSRETPIAPIKKFSTRNTSQVELTTSSKTNSQPTLIEEFCASQTL